MREIKKDKLRVTKQVSQEDECTVWNIVNNKVINTAVCYI